MYMNFAAVPIDIYLPSDVAAPSQSFWRGLVTSTMYTCISKVYQLFPKKADLFLPPLPYRLTLWWPATHPPTCPRQRWRHCDLSEWSGGDSAWNQVYKWVCRHWEKLLTIHTDRREAHLNNISSEPTKPSGLGGSNWCLHVIKSLGENGEKEEICL